VAVPPKLLFSTAAFFARPLEQTFELVASCGYTGVEVMVTKDPASQDPDEMRRLADLHGLRIGALHAPALLLTKTVWGMNPVGKIERAAEVAVAANIPLVVMHPPYRWERRYRRWVRTQLPGFQKETGAVVALENMFPVHVGKRRLVFHADHDVRVLDDAPHLVLDTSHAAVSRHDLIEVRRQFGDRLRHIHLSDNAGKGWDSHLPPGQGILPLDGFMRDLVASGYEGSISLEVDLRAHLTEPEPLRELLIGMREWVEGYLT
jgi:sugar phosphate isomerase/epimerase